MRTASSTENAINTPFFIDQFHSKLHYAVDGIINTIFSANEANICHLVDKNAITQILLEIHLRQWRWTSHIDVSVGCVSVASSLCFIHTYNDKKCYLLTALSPRITQHVEVNTTSSVLPSNDVTISVTINWPVVCMGHFINIKILPLFANCRPQF